MGSHEISIEPHELTITGTLIYMQGDPTGGDGTAWDTLMETPKAVGTKGRDELLDALAALAETPEDAETLRKLEPGGPTLNNAAEWYLKVVTGFPMPPPASSTKVSKRTGGT